MCQVQNNQEGIYLHLDQDSEPNDHMLTEGEKFIKLLSKNQLLKSISNDKIERRKEQFISGISLPPVPEKVFGLTSLDKFEELVDNEKSVSQEHKVESLDQLSSSNVSQLFNFDLGRHYKEAALSIKPESKETKLLSYFLANQTCFKLPQSKATTDALNEVLKNHESYNIDLKSQIDKVNEMKEELAKSNKPRRKTGIIKSRKSLWDIKKERKYKSASNDKEYTCENPFLLSQDEKNVTSVEGAKKFIMIKERNLELFTFKKISDDDIRKLDRFSHYNRGPLSNGLYIKNISKKVSEEMFTCLIVAALNNCNISGEGITCRLLSGRMKGQAFVLLKSEQDATALLECINGLKLEGQPIIVQYRTNRKD